MTLVDIITLIHRLVSVRFCDIKIWHGTVLGMLWKLPFLLSTPQWTSIGYLSMKNEPLHNHMIYIQVFFSFICYWILKVWISHENE